MSAHAYPGGRFDDRASRRTFGDGPGSRGADGRRPPRPSFPEPSESWRSPGRLAETSSVLDDRCFPQLLAQERRRPRSGVEMPGRPPVRELMPLLGRLATSDAPPPDPRPPPPPSRRRAAHPALRGAAMFALGALVALAGRATFVELGGAEAPTQLEAQRAPSTDHVPTAAAPAPEETTRQTEPGSRGEAEPEAQTQRPAEPDGEGRTEPAPLDVPMEPVLGS